MTAAARYVGARVNRVKDARLLTGRGVYVDDIDLPGTLHAWFVRSPFARAPVGGINLSRQGAAGRAGGAAAPDLNPSRTASSGTG